MWYSYGIRARFRAMLVTLVSLVLKFRIEAEYDPMPHIRHHWLQSTTSSSSESQQGSPFSLTDSNPR